MDVTVTDEAVELVNRRGGRLYVWMERPPSCCGFAYLGTATQPPAGRDFRPVDADGLALYVDTAMRRLPDELNVGARGWRRRKPAAFWDGCAWVP